MGSVVMDNSIVGRLLFFCLLDSSCTEKNFTHTSFGRFMKTWMRLLQYAGPGYLPSIGNSRKAPIFFSVRDGRSVPRRASFTGRGA